MSYISYTMPRNCVNSTDNFCHICGEVFQNEKSINSDGEKAYECYFDCKVGDQDKKKGSSYML